MDDKQGFREWCVLEFLGHRRLGGLLTEQEIAGAAFLRIDVPETVAGPASTHFFGASSVYAINPVTEDIARSVAASTRPEPVERWEYPSHALTAPARVGDWDARAVLDDPVTDEDLDENRDEALP